MFSVPWYITRYMCKKDMVWWCRRSLDQRKELRPHTFILNLAAAEELFLGLESIHVFRQTHPKYVRVKNSDGEILYNSMSSLNQSTVWIFLEENYVNVIKCPRFFQVQRRLLNRSSEGFRSLMRLPGLPPEQLCQLCAWAPLDVMENGSLTLTIICDIFTYIHTYMCIYIYV